jgi:hypothetical protein
VDATASSSQTVVAGWYVAVLAAGLLAGLALLVLALRRGPLQPTPRLWLLRAVLWILSAAFFGPLALALSIGIISFLADTSGPSPVAMILYVTLMGSGVAVIAMVPCYAPLLLVWSRVGGFAELEASRRGVLLGTFLLSLPAAAGAILVNLSSTGMVTKLINAQELLANALGLGFGTWAGLLVPRLIVPFLKPGIFRTGDRHHLTTA